MKEVLTADDVINAKTEVQEHLWVRIMVELVDVRVAAGEIHADVSPENAQRAREDAVYGCYFCDDMLTLETLETKCPGPDQKMKSIIPSEDT